tara:strand:- start:1241 stop:1423 length:183 start_codon:yes stop_codon:yes gene_type:complete
MESSKFQKQLKEMRIEAKIVYSITGPLADLCDFNEGHIPNDVRAAVLRMELAKLEESPND